METLALNTSESISGTEYTHVYTYHPVQYRCGFQTKNT